MNFSRISVIPFLSLLLFCLSCVEDRMPSGVQLSRTPYMLSIDKSTFEFNAGKELVATLSIKSENVAWEITGKPEWVTLSKATGEGSADIQITVAENKEIEKSRVAVLQLASTTKGYVCGKSITVSQSGAQEPASFSLEGTVGTFGWKGSENFGLTVVSNKAWKVLAAPEWVTVTPGEGGKGTTEVVVCAAENRSLDTRSGNLRIGIENTGLYYDIKVEQTGMSGFSDVALEFGWESSERTLELALPSSWSATASVEWLSLSQYSGKGGESVVVKAQTNDGEDARTGTLSIVTDSDTYIVSVSQQGQYLKISTTAGEFTAMGGSVSLDVSSSVGAKESIEYQGDVKDWITSSKQGDSKYTLAVAYNPSVNGRNAFFVIKPTMSTTGTACTQGVKFSVVQKGRVLSVSTDSIGMYAAGGESPVYTIVADGKYTLTKPEADDWYSLQYNGQENSFSVTFTKNDTKADRTSLLTVSLEELPAGETREAVIEIVQYCAGVNVGGEGYGDDVDWDNYHEPVDLGLPSGIKWATCNVGASKPEEYGGYYAWGETEEKSDCSWDTYKWYKGSEDTLTKYCTSSDYGTVDNKSVLDPEDDVAHVKWGGSWRMPTVDEINELRTECTWTWTTQNGVNGYRVTGPNGNSIFLPAAGWLYGTDVDDRGSHSWYWSSSLRTSDSNLAHCLSFDSGDVSWRSSATRGLGLSVRPVDGESKVSVSVSTSGSGSVSIEGETGSSVSVVAGSSVTVKATPTGGYIFTGWYVGSTLVSRDASYTFVVSENVSLVAKFEKPDYNGHEYVDLGLPSGIKWATCNVGATKPEGNGGYYAWGEIEKKSDYSWETYKWCKGSETTMTKYCTSSDYGTVDNKSVLDPEDDVAHVNWGGSWRMPTYDEIKELITECTWTETTWNGVINGYRVTGPNGKSIFLPAAGFREGTHVYNRGSYGNYWSSSLLSSTSDSSDCACFLNFTSGYVDWGGYVRYFGRSVRPVSK